MCFGLAPGFIVQDDLEADLEEALADDEPETESDTPSFAADEPAAGEALTGSEATETTGHGGSPK